MTPGLYDIPAAEYHAMKGIFSRSAGLMLLQATPLHVAQPAEDEDRAAARDIGTAIHALLLEGRMDVVEVAAKNWQTKAAKEAHAAAKEAGKLALLSKQIGQVEDAVKAARAYIQQVPELARAFDAGAAERTAIFEAGGIVNRILIDWRPDDPKAFLVDVKTTGTQINPISWSRNAVNLGHDMQGVMYAEGDNALGAKRPGMLFLVVEQDRPHACCVMGLAPSLEDLGRRRLDRARGIWRRCVEAGDWPGFPPVIHHADAPPWADMQEEEAGLRAEQLTKQRPYYMPESKRVVTSGVPFA